MSRPNLHALFEPRSLLLVVNPEQITGLSVSPAHAPQLAQRRYTTSSLRAYGRDAKAAWSSTRGRPDLAVIAVDPNELTHTLARLTAAPPRALLILSLCPRDELAACHEWAKHHDCHLLGPHSFGLQRPPNGLNLSRHEHLTQVGRVALITQSSALMAAVMDWADDTRTPFSAIVALGDRPTLTVGELLDYFAFDPHTDSIALCLEDLGPVRPFLSALRGAARVKPVVVLRPGRRAPRAAGIPSAPDPVIDAALRRAGALRVRFFLQLFSTLKVLGQAQQPQGGRIALVTNGHGPVALAQDSLALYPDTRRARFTETTRDRLANLLSAHGDLNNPVIESAPWRAERFGGILDSLLADPGVDVVLVVLTPDPQTNMASLTDALAQRALQHRKPLIISLMGDGGMRRLRARLAERGVPAFRTPETAADALGQKLRFQAHQALLLQTQAGEATEPGPLSPAHLATLATAWQQASPGSELPAPLQEVLLSHYGLTSTAAPPQGVIASARAQVFRDPEIGATLLLQPTQPWPAARSDSLELLPLNGFLIRRLIERSPLWRQTLASHALPPALEALEQILLKLTAMAVAHPEIATLTLDPILITDHSASLLHARLEWADQTSATATEGVRAAPHLAIAPYPRRWHQTRHFADGTPWQLRPIRPEDADGLQHFIRALSTETRYMRFVSTLKELPPRLLARYTQIDYDREVALVATVQLANPAHRNHPRETLIGLAHFLRNSDGGGAEYALVVADDWQRRGLGPALMTALLTAARELGVRHLEGQVLAGNQVMLTMMRKLGFQCDPDPEEPTLRRVWRALHTETDAL